MPPPWESVRLSMMTHLCVDPLLLDYVVFTIEMPLLGDLRAGLYSVVINHCFGLTFDSVILQC